MCFKKWGPILLTFLKALGPRARQELLDISNLIFSTGKSPQISKVAYILPLKKAGNTPGCIPSYRPLSLTSCVAKTLERILYNRLYFVAGARDWLCTEQAGFRKNRSCDGYQANKPKKTVRPSVTYKIFPSWGNIGYWNKHILGDLGKVVGVLHPYSHLAVS